MNLLFISFLSSAKFRQIFITEFTTTNSSEFSIRYMFGYGFIPTFHGLGEMFDFSWYFILISLLSEYVHNMFEGLSMFPAKLCDRSCLLSCILTNT